MPNGMTPDQMVDRMYTELVGLDGKSGMKKDIADIKEDGIKGRKKLHDKIDHIEKNMVSKEECSTIRKGAGDRKDKILMRIKDFILIAIAIFTILWGSGVFAK